jgi:phenylalanyl-tRNA synthetase alpha chain
VNRKLHLQPQNPISIIRQLIEGHFSDFKTFNNLNPVVTTKQNFDSLYIPKEHVSRSKSDNYYFNKDTLLRAHTSAHQLEGLASGEPKFLISGDVYRRDEIDSSHYPVFHQIEGFYYFDNDADTINADLKRLQAKETPNIELVDDTLIKPENPIQTCHSTEVSNAIAAHLKHSINSMIRTLFADEPNLKVRWIDAYFPFTSPSWEVEILYKGEWLEVLGCGVVNQKIMNQAGLQNKVGWAFGMGLERLAMVLFGIPDIRLFWSQDERFISQFTPGQINKFEPFSKYPACIKDISFWLPKSEWHENDFSEIVRGAAGDIVENVKLVNSKKKEDKFD